MLARTVSLYRNAYTGLSRSTWLLSLVMLVNRSGTMVIPFMTIYLTRPAMGYTIGQAGVVMGIFGLGAVCGGFMGGRFTDRWGFHRVQMITLCGGGVLFMVLGQMKSYPLICGATFLLSLVNEAFRPANSTAIAQYSKEENRTRSYSLNRLAINLGWAAGASIGGILASIDYHLLFWADGVTNIAAALLLRGFLAPSPGISPDPSANIADAGSRSGGDGRTAGTASPYRDKKYLEFIVCTILFALCFFQLFTVLPVYYKQQLGLKEYWIGLLMGMNGVLIALFEMVLVFTLEQRRENLFYICIGVLLVSASFLFLNIAPSSITMVVFCMLLVTAGEMMAMPFMNSFWISRTGVGNRGQYAGLYTIAWSVAQVLGPTGGAQVAGHWGFRILWWLLGGICLLAATGFHWLKRRPG